MRAAALNLLWRAHRARLENRLVEAHSDITAAVAVCRDANESADVAFALKRLAQVERDLREYESARRHYEEAASIYRERDDRINLAHTIRHVGDVYEDAGRPDLAAPHYEEALRLYRGSRGVRRGDLANAVRSMAIHLEHVGDTIRARLLWSEARDLYASLDRPWRRLLRRRPNSGVLESTEHLARLGG